MSVENNQTSYWEMATLGVIRGVIPFPLEHVLERLKLESQTHPEKTTQKSVKDLWTSTGVKGLFSGSRANFIRRTVREAYHWPVMLSLNRIWKRVIPKELNKDNLSSNIATGYSMALVHAGITLPLERLFIEMATKKGYRPILEKMRRERQLFVYQGFQATWLRHSLVWNLFFIANHVSTHAFKALDPRNSHPYLSYLGISMLTSNIVVGVGYPIEFLRNRILMEPEILKKGTLNAMKTLFHRYKWINLYSGAPVVTIHNFIQTLIIQTLFDKINRK